MMHGLQFPLETFGCMAHMGGLPAWKLDWTLYLGMALFACLSSENSCRLANQFGGV